MIAVVDCIDARATPEQQEAAVRGAPRLVLAAEDQRLEVLRIAAAVAARRRWLQVRIVGECPHGVKGGVASKGRPHSSVSPRGMSTDGEGPGPTAVRDVGSGPIARKAHP